MSDTGLEVDNGPGRLFIAFLEEWNDRHPGDGLALSGELQDMVERYLDWSRIMGAEAVIHHVQRCLELTPHLNDNIKYGCIMELLRRAEPNESDVYKTFTPRIYNLPEEKITA